MLYYCIRKAAAAKTEHRMITDNYPGAKMPKFRTKAEAIAELKRIRGEALAEGYDVESLREHRPGQPYTLRGLRFSDCAARYFIDLCREESNHLKRLVDMDPAEMNVRPQSSDYANPKFI